MKRVTYNYFKAEKKRLTNDNKNIVRYGKFTFVCDNANQADLMRKWLKAGDKFEIK